MGRSQKRLELKQKCDCGCGRLKKNCNREEIIHHDKTSFAFVTFYQNNANRIDGLRKQWYQKYKKTATDEIAKSNGSLEDTERKIVSALDALVEPALQEKIKRKNIYEWFILERRMSPIGPAIQYFRRSHSLSLVKIYLSNLVLRYGSFLSDEPVKKSDEINFSEDDYLAMYEMEMIAIWIQKLSVFRRFNAKGAKVEVLDGEISCNPSPEFEKAIELFDDANELGVGLLPYFGLSEELNTDSEREVKKLILATLPNNTNKPFQFLNHKIMTSNFVPGMYAAEKVEELSHIISKSFLDARKLEYKKWIDCLRAVSNTLIGENDERTIFQVLKTGYSLLDVKDFTSLVSSLGVSVDAQELEAFFKDAVLEKTGVQSLSEHFSTSFIFRISEQQYLVDGLRIFQFLSRKIIDTFEKVPVDGKAEEDLRGFLFEEQVQSKIDKYTSGKSQLTQPFVPNAKLKKNGNQIIEIDHSLLINNNLLILLDSKSILWKPAVDTGDFQKTRSRIATVTGKVSKRDIKIKEIVQIDKFDNNVSLKQYTHCTSQIISALNEWLPPDDPSLWWAEGIPRVSTIDKFFKVVLPYFLRQSNFDFHSEIYKL